MNSKAQKAYEKNRAEKPLYPGDGDRRPAWGKAPQVLRAIWSEHHPEKPA